MGRTLHEVFRIREVRDHRTGGTVVALNPPNTGSNRDPEIDVLRLVQPIPGGRDRSSGGWQAETAADLGREATSDEVKELKAEARQLKETLAAPQRGYDEPGILSYAISSFCPTSADGLQNQLWRQRGRWRRARSRRCCRPSDYSWVPTLRLRANGLPLLCSGCVNSLGSMVATSRLSIAGRRDAPNAFRKSRQSSSGSRSMSLSRWQPHQPSPQSKRQRSSRSCSRLCRTRSGLV